MPRSIAFVGGFDGNDLICTIPVFPDHIEGLFPGFDIQALSKRGQRIFGESDFDLVVPIPQVPQSHFFLRGLVVQGPVFSYRDRLVLFGEQDEGPRILAVRNASQQKQDQRYNAWEPGRPKGGSERFIE